MTDEPAEVARTPATGRLILRLAVRALLSLAFLIGLLTLTLTTLGVPPLTGLRALWVGAIGDSQTGHIDPLSETVVKATPLLLTGLGVTVSWQAGLFSIGAEGQLLIGALAAMALGRGLHGLPGPLLTLLMLVGGTAAGALWGAAAGWLRVRRNVQEVISTIMLNYVALYLLGWAISGPLQEAGHLKPETDPVPDAALFARLVPAAWTGGVPTRLHAGTLLAFGAVVAVSLFLFRTRSGFGLRIVGQNPEAARITGYAVDRLRLLALSVSGGLCGLAGVVELLGITGRLYEGFSPGWGFTAIPVALLGALQPLGTLFSALFFGALTAGSGNLARFSGVSSALINVLQAAAVLAVVGVRAWREKGETH